MRVTLCPDESLCCGAENNSCCENHDGVWIRNGEISKVNPVSSSWSTASSATSSLSTLSLVSSSTNPTLSSSVSPAQSGLISASNDIGAIVGGVVGGVIGILLSVGAAWFISRRRKPSRVHQSAPSRNEPSSVMNEPLSHIEISGRERPHEIDSQALVEIRGKAVDRPSELPTAIESSTCPR